MSFYDFSATPASNTTVGGIGSQGSSSANLIDDLIRELAASGRQFLNDIGGANTVGGTADAITITPSSGAISAVADGMFIGFIAGADNTSGTVTANVGGLGAEPVKKAVDGAETTLAVGDIQSGGYYALRWRAAWDSAGGAWQLIDMNVPTIRGTGAAPMFAPRAWVAFNGTGTLAVLGSGNVASVTDNGTGNYTINFTTAMPDTNYSVVMGVEPDALFASGGAATRVAYVSTKAVGSVTVQTGYQAAGGSANVDFPYIAVAVFR